MSAAESFGFEYRFLSYACSRIDAARTGQPVDDRCIANVLAPREMRGEEIAMQLREGHRLVEANPLGGGERKSRIGKAGGPAQRKSGRFGFPLKAAWRPA